MRLSSLPFTVILAMHVDNELSQVPFSQASCQGISLSQAGRLRPPSSRDLRPVSGTAECILYLDLALGCRSLARNCQVVAHIQAGFSYWQVAQLL